MQQQSLTKASEVVARLNAVLPLADRYAGLDSSQKQLYSHILNHLLSTGAAIAQADLASRYHMDVSAVMTVLQSLAAMDLIVVDTHGAQVIGAYPLTTENTPHQLTMGKVRLQAMCAFDALALSAISGQPLQISSCCAVTGSKISLQQQGDHFSRISPAPPLVGIRWQQTGGCAAHSLCRDMVFLQDITAARQWAQDTSVSVMELEQAVIAAKAFFAPLFAGL